MDNDKYIGRLLDNRYEILEVIGTGGMAVVYKARCHRLNRLVAIKILKDDLSQDEEFRRRFHAESQAVAMLSHPNIMSVYDVSTTDEADYIVMELIDGITLKQYMEKKGVLNWKETLHFGMQIAKALEHAHSRGIVHRDIKPHNVMVLKNGSVKVTDFGIARIMSKSNTLTKEALGSVHYISPEQAKGGRVDARSDLYSLGVVMYEMMTGRPPYDGESAVSVAIQHINGTPKMPSVLNPNIPGGLEQIIMKAMEKDPAKRYASATEMLYDLEEFRKNPSILFNFNSGSIDDVVPLVRNQAAVSGDETVVLPGRLPADRNPAPRPQRPAQNSGDPVRTGTAAKPQNAGASNARRPQNRPQAHSGDRHPSRQERETQAEDRNRTMTIAVVTCSAIAVIAIIIFLVVTLNGGLFRHESSLVPVPQLVGKVFAELDRKQYPDVSIDLQDFEYDAEQAEGIIIRQKPESGEKVAPGTEVKVWVSMGPQETESQVLMGNLVGTTQESAKLYFDALSVKIVPIVRQENDDTVKEGEIIRTEPAEGQPLKDGQTVVIYVSIGPAEKTADVPNVVGMSSDKAINTLKAAGFEKTPKIEIEESIQPKDEVLRLSVDVNSKVDTKTEIILYVSAGYLREPVPNVLGLSLDQAKALLEDAGFRNVRESREHNDAAKDTVFRQSVAKGVEVDTTTEIVLTVSDGPEETVPPTTEAPKDITKKVSVDLSLVEPKTDPETGKPMPYKLTIMLLGKTVYDQTVDGSTQGVVVDMTGQGVLTYDVYIDGVLLFSDQVNFRG